jgi:2-isopropylmalate synthase
MRELILRVEERPAVGELKKHVAERGRRFVFIDNRNFPKGKMYVIARAVKDVKEPYESATLRSHTVDAAMLFIGNEEDLKGLKAEVTLSGEKFPLESPACVYLPAGVQHTYRIIEGSGIYIKIVLAPGGDYNAVTK